MKLTKKQVEMIKGDSENATYKHGYDTTIIDLCNDWLELSEENNELYEFDLFGQWVPKNTETK